MIRVHINIICMNISALTEYKATFDENCIGASQK